MKKYILIGLISFLMCGCTTTVIEEIYYREDGTISCRRITKTRDNLTHEQLNPCVGDSKEVNIIQ